jgi:YfiH family protein
MDELNRPPRALPTVSGLSWPGVRYFCTTRQGGVSGPPWETFNLGLHAGDDPDHVMENRRRLRAMLPAEPVWLRQVHGADVFDADASSAGRAGMQAPGVPVSDAPEANAQMKSASPVGLSESGVPVADAAVTTQRGRVLAIMTADCLPVVIAGADGKSLGVAHAGWRGLAAGVLEATLDALRARAPQGAPWRAWIGPAITQRHFEVGNDVRQAFCSADAQAAQFFAEKVPGSKWLADLPGLARHRLHRAGVGNIEFSGECTYAEGERYFSYRRDGQTGRIATVAWLE